MTPGEKQELAAPFESTVDGAWVGDEYFAPPIFQSNRIFKFRKAELVFMKALQETGDFSKAAVTAGKDMEWAKSFLSKPSTRQFLEDRFQEAAIKQGVTADWMISELYGVWAGTTKKSREQMEAIKEIGSRIWPRVEKISHSFEADEIVFMAKKESFE